MNGDQLPGEPGLVGELEEVFAQLLLLDVRGRGQHRFEAAVLSHQPGRGLGTDPGHAGHIVRGVAHQPEEVDDLIGFDAEFLAHAIGLDEFVLVGGAAGIQQLNAGSHQLHEVLVPGDDRHLQLLRDRFEGQGADQVVGFVPLLFQNGHSHGFSQLADARQLGAHLVGHLLPGGLVFFVHPVPEGRRGRVEEDGQVVGLMPSEQLDQGVGKAEDRAGVFALGIDQGVVDEREVGPIGNGHAVDEEDACSHEILVPVSRQVRLCGEPGPPAV